MLTHQIKGLPHYVQRIGEGLDVPTLLRGAIQSFNLLAHHLLCTCDVIARQLKMLLSEISSLHWRAVNMRRLDSPESSTYEGKEIARLA